MRWVREAGLEFTDAPEDEEIPESTELEELQTFVGNKRNKVWLWTAVNHWRANGTKIRALTLPSYSFQVAAEFSTGLFHHGIRFRTTFPNSWFGTPVAFWDRFMCNQFEQRSVQSLTLSPARHS